MIGARATVPCNGCNACCQGEAVMVIAEAGDRVDDYLTRQVYVPGYGIVPCLEKTDGHCIYLVDGKCSIWSRAPHICRTFDCRKFYLSQPRADRRRMVKAGAGSEAVMIAAKERLHTLSAGEVAEAKAIKESRHGGYLDGKQTRDLDRR